MGPDNADNTAMTANGISPAVPPASRKALRRALIQGLILVLLCCWAFWPQVTRIFWVAGHNVDWTHALVFPLAIGVLMYSRQKALARDLRRGSTWGVVLLLLAVGAYAVATWPFSVGYLQAIQIMPALAGVILAIGGWRVLLRSLPMLLLVFLSIPIGQSIYASLSIRPETITLDVSRFLLDMLPGVSVRLEGPDLIYSGVDRAGAIALGQPHRGASLLLAYMGIGVFVVFARIRPLWQVVIMAGAAVPVMLLCNLLRLVMQGLMTIYTDASPLSHIPRNLSSALSLLLAYGIFVLGCAVLGVLVVEKDEGEEDENGEIVEDA